MGEISTLETTVSVAEPEKVMKKVAIVGFAESSRHLAPYNDPSFEIWGLNELYHTIPRWTRWFQIHNRDVFQGDFSDRDEVHVEQLAGLKCPVYMVKAYEDIPNAVKFPIEEAAKFFTLCKEREGCDKVCTLCRKMDAYFTNSISYMIALAIMEGFDEIHVYGVDMAQDSEYGHQKPSCEFFLGWARGAGIKVVLPDESDLCRSFFYYGYEKGPLAQEKFRLKKDEMQRRITECQANVAKIQEQKKQLEQQEIMQMRIIDHLQGGSQTVDYFLKNWGPIKI